MRRFPACASAVLSAMLIVAGCHTGGGFDPKIWAAERGNYDGENRRNGMAADLDDAGIRVGVQRSLVRKLLGEPDSTGPDADIYYLGRSSVGPSFETYRIDYDATGRVEAARLERS